MAVISRDSHGTATTFERRSWHEADVAARLAVLNISGQPLLLKTTAGMS
jgi:hypothetical protein